MNRLLFTLLLIISASASLFSFPENNEARLGLRELITAPTVDVLKARGQEIEQMTDGSRVSFQVKQQNDSYYLLFLNESNGRFPVYSRGSYIIKRNLSDGKFQQIKVFLKNHTECYARLYPMDERVMMEIVLYGTTIYTDINLPYRFADVLTGPFSEVIDASSGIVDWAQIFPESDFSLYSDKQKLSNEIRKKLPLINDVDDGAIDADGSYVYIEDLNPQPEGSRGFNCSGFVKWVADGLYWADAGEYMSIADLKLKQLEQRGNRWSIRHEDERDPYFGLDWTRNIAAAVTEAQKGVATAYKASDVDSIPWSRYTPDVGYPIEDLKLIMYYLGIEEPLNIYLASINVSWGTEPILRQHIHTAVLVPVIDKQTGFNDLVFERNVETNAELLAERYPGAQIHLTRIKAGDGFSFPELEHKPAIGTGSFFRR